MSDYKKIPVNEFLEMRKNLPVIDVRSPKEFKKAHIPKAYNIPLFSDDERAEVGTIYKKQGKEKAVLRGLEIVGCKMKDFVVEAKKISKSNKVLVHCWRGGMRSESMAWLFQTAGIETYVLEGGYKAYRRYIKEQLSEKLKIVILSGYTGSGKTDILKEIEKNGEQFIDLEGIAHHKGSAFGAIGEDSQLSTEMFENNLFEKFLQLDKNKTIWLEDESKAIGKNFIPDELFLQMRNAPVIRIELVKNLRIKRLIKEYTNIDKEVLIFHLNRIKKRLGPNETKLAIEAVENNDLYKAVDIALTFYDKAYDYGLSKRDKSKIYTLKLNEDNPKLNAGLIIDFYYKHLQKTNTN